MQNENALYSRLALELIADIREGKYPIGSFLPTDSEFSAQYELSRHTVREALRVLTANGMIRRRAGVGTIVTATEPATRTERWTTLQELLAHSRDTRQRIIAVEETSIDEEIAELVRGRAGDRWLCVTLLRFSKGATVPYSVSEVYVTIQYAGAVRKHTVPGTEAPFKKTIFNIIQNTYGVKGLGVEQTISAVQAPSHIARPLDIKARSTALKVVRKYFNEDKDVIELSVSHFPQAFSYTVTLAIDDDNSAPSRGKTARAKQDR
jgi:GntR family transcriptional regulator